MSEYSETENTTTGTSINLYELVYTIHDVRNRLRRALIRLGILSGDWHEEEQIDERATGGFDLEDCRDAINNMGGDITVNRKTKVNVAAKKRAMAYDANLVASNIRKNVSILGVTGTYGGSGTNPNLKVCEWTYGTAAAPTTIGAPSDASGWSKVHPVLATGSSLTLIPENIRKDIDIMGVIGNFSFLNMSGAHNPTYCSKSQTLTITLGILPYAPATGFDTLTTDDIQIGWVNLLGDAQYPDAPIIFGSGGYEYNTTYITHLLFGKNQYDNNAKFLIAETLYCSQSTGIVWNRVYVNNAPYTFTPISAANGSINFTLSNATYQNVTYHNIPAGTPITFANGPYFYKYYHADIRW